MKLSQKGIVLVLVPVAFEFVFVGSLFYLLNQQEAELKLAEKARRKNVYLNRIHRAQMVLMGGLMPYEGARVMRGSQRTELAKKLWLDEVALLERNFADDPATLAFAAQMKKTMDDGMAMANEIKSSMGGRFDMDALVKFKKARKLITALSTLTDKMSLETEQIEEEAPIRMAKTREQLKLLLLAGLVINIGLALGMAVFFSKGTVARLSTVMDNTKRLAAEQELNKPLNGNDEIAVLDQTLRRMAEQRAEIARKERALLENAADVICSLNESGTITDVSPACAKIWGYAPDELLSTSLNNLVSADTKETTSQQIAAARQGNADITFENRIKRKDGNLVDMLWSINWTPEEKTYFCVAHNNSERKEVERMKQEFVAMLSHDLRSPLNSVQAFFTMISDNVYGPLSEKGMKKVKSLEDTIAWLIEMISDLLDIDKIEAGLFDLNLKTVSLRSVVEKAEDALQSLAEKQKVDIELANMDAIVALDQELFMRVITNLISNAIKFSQPNSTVKIEIEKLGEHVELRVIDSGPGIAPENQDTIFERFRQVSGVGADNRRSSGLGLAVARAIVEQHRGTIGVKSELGKGSIFWVRLPSGDKQKDQASGGVS